MKKIAIVGSRNMSRYGKEVIEMLMKELINKCEVATIEVSGCNKEVIRLGAKKIFKGENFEKLNEEMANYADILVIIEGSQQSGTILLAEKFVEKGKAVYCVPGRITDDNSRATNWLIAQGAIPLISIESLTEGDMIVDNG
jgi:predicted Rossmann fold nucleotide-binding protein DprA/Smf involved in DNA uptake